MKKLLKILSVFLCVLMIGQLLPLTTMAQAVNEELEREEYLRETLSDYLLGIVDINDITEIVEPEPYFSLENVQDTQLTLVNKKGENVTYVFSEPVAFYDENGELQYKEINIVEQQDENLLKDGYAYTNGTNNYRVSFSELVTTGLLVDTGDVTWKLSALGTDTKNNGSVSSEKIDNKDTDVFIYENAFGENTLLKYYPQLNGVKEDIILNSYTGTNEFSFSLTVEDGYAVLNEDMTVTVYKYNSDEASDTFIPPYAIDSFKDEDFTSYEQHFVDCEYSLNELSDGEYILTVIVPEDFLNAETTVYPVIIDPTTSSIYQSVDTPVYSGYPTTSYGSNTTNCFGRASGYGYGRVLTKFTVPSAINNYATISSAYLWVRETTGRTTTTYVRPYMNTSSFSGSTTWNTKPSYDSNTSMSNKNINSNSTDGGASVYWYKFDIVYAVRKWTTGTTNNGLSFISNEESNGAYNWRAFASAEHGTSSYRPYAVITYTNDTTAPTISNVSKSPTSWTDGNVTLTVTASDSASGINSYSFDNGSTWQTGNSKSFSSNRSVNVKVKDNAGNIASYSANPVSISNIDKAAPEVVSVSKNPTAWTNGSVTLTVNASDVGSGVSYYSFDGKTTWQQSNTKSVSANGIYSVYVKDGAGNVSSPEFPVTVSNIDKTITSTDNITVTGNPDSWTNTDVTLTVSATDTGGSGISQYSFDGKSTWQSSNTKTFSSNDVVSIAVKDSAGNVSGVKPVPIEYIDKTPPATPYGFISGSFLSIKSFDTGTVQSPEHFEYQIGNGNWYTYSTPVKMVCTSDTTIHIKAVDSAGNETQGSDVVMKRNIGVYNITKDDIRSGDFMLPSGFVRTYDSNTKQWFFAITTNIQSECNGNALKYTDFYGESTYFFKYNGTDRFYSHEHKKIIEDISGQLLIGGTTVYYRYLYEYENAKLFFDSTGRLVAVIDGSQKVRYNWNSSSLVVSDNRQRTYTIALSNGVPTSITDCVGNTASYTWTNGKLTSFTNALNYTENYVYDSSGRLTGNGTETISYTSDGRVRQITQQNGSYIKYEYKDNQQYFGLYFIAPVIKYGIARISDSRGLYTDVLYSSGFTAGQALDPNDEDIIYSGSAAGAPALTENFGGCAYRNTTIFGLSLILYYADMPISVVDDEHYAYYSYNTYGQPTGEVIIRYDSEDPDYALPTSFTEAQNHEYAEAKYAYAYSGSNMTEETYWENITETGTPAWANISKTTYTYNSDDLPISKTDYEYNNAQWEWTSYDTYSYSYTYDSLSGAMTKYTLTTSSYSPAKAVPNADPPIYYPQNPVDSDKTQPDIVAVEYDPLNRAKSETTSDGTQYYTYDALSRTATSQLNTETVITYTYDNNDNVISRSQGNNEDTFVYTNGNLTSFTSSGGDVTTYSYDQYGNLTTQEFDIYTLSYNSLGSLISAEVNSDEIVSYGYTGAKQDIAEASFANGQEIEYSYTDGRLTSVSLGNTQKYSYVYTLDDDNNVTQTVITDNAGGLTKTVTDTLTSVSSGNTLLYSVEKESVDEEDENSFNGKVYTVGSAEYTLVEEENKDTFIAGNTEYEKTYTYADDKLTGIGYTGIFSSTYTYNNNDLISSLTHMLSGINKGYGYTYNSNGNITSETQTVTQNNVTTSETINYSYDGKSQLVSAENDSVKWTYTYDNRGNILTKSEYSISLDGNNQKVYTLIDMDTFNYTNSAWQDELTSYNNQTIAYDAAGNPTNYRGNTLTWTMGRQLASYGNICYTYNEDGIRTSKTANNVTTRYYLDGTNIIAQTDGTSTVFFRYDSNDEIVGLTYRGADFFYVKNQMGDIIGIVNTDGTLVAEYEYDPWGAVISVTGSNTALANTNPFRYRSYYYDSDSGMYYLQNRYYDPEICRFVNADNEQFLLYGINLYCYCNNNPINNKDINGCFSTDQLVLLGMVITGNLKVLFYNCSDSYLKDNDYDISNSHVEFSFGGVTFSYGTDIPHPKTISDYLKKIKGVQGYVTIANTNTRNLVPGEFEECTTINIHTSLAENLKLLFVITNSILIHLPESPTATQSNKYKVKSGKYKTYKLLSNNCTTFVRDTLSSIVKNKLSSKNKISYALSIDPKSFYKVLKNITN